MKAENIIILGIAGVTVYYLLKGQPAAAVEYQQLYTGEAFPQAAAQIAASSQQSNAAYKTAVSNFLNSPVNTTQSIRAGVDLINTAQSTGTALPRLSQTLQKVAYNSNVARLADGSIKLVTVKQAARDKSGMTALDRVIAANKAAKK